MMQEQTLNRADGRLVAFMGEQIADGSTKQRYGDRKTRWYTTRVFKTADGHRVGIAHKTAWEGERDEFWILDFNNDGETTKDILTSIHQHVTDAAQADELSGTIESQLNDYNRNANKRRANTTRTKERKSSL